MVLSVIAAAFILVLPVELPDKTLFATLVLATRFKPLPVFTGVGLAFAVQSLIAVTAGSLLTLLPDAVVSAVVAVLFLVGAVILWRSVRSGAEEEEDIAEAPAAPVVPQGGVHLLRRAVRRRVGRPLPAGHRRPRRPLRRPGVGVHRLVGRPCWSSPRSAVFLGKKLADRLPIRLIRMVAAVLFPRLRRHRRRRDDPAAAYSLTEIGLDPDVASGCTLVLVRGGRNPMNVGEVAALAGVTVRTLHHYDRIGLLSPSGRTATGYRQYAPADLDRLHQVLLYRELGFPLEEVATLLDDPSADPGGAPAPAAPAAAGPAGADAGDGRGRREGDGGTSDGDLTDPGGAVRGVRRERPGAVRGRGGGALGRDRRVRAVAAPDAAYTQGGLGADQGGGATTSRRRFAAALRDGVAGRLGAGDGRRRGAPAARSPGTSTTARPRCTPGSAGCTSRTSGSPRHYEQIAPGLAQYVSTAVQANAARQG